MNLFEKAICDSIKQYFISNSIRYNEVDDFQLMLIQYLNSMYKHITPIRRNVHISDNLMLNSDYTEEITAFKEKFENGEDMNGHLSRKIYNADYFDALLNSWNIYHFHLSMVTANTDSEMAINRSSTLLFAYVGENDVYFIDIANHSQQHVFSMFSLLETGQRNWEEIFEPLELKDIISLNRVVTNDSELGTLLKNHINLVYKINGKYYLTNLGVSTTGSKTEHTRYSIELSKKLKKLFPRIPEYPTNILFTLSGDVNPFGELEWNVGFNNYKVTLIV